MEKNHVKHGIMVISVCGMHRWSWYFHRNKVSGIRDGLIKEREIINQKNEQKKPQILIYVKATENMTNDEGKSPA